VGFRAPLAALTSQAQGTLGKLPGLGHRALS
jgi:hypothetical protein